jgi:hypothetical protein
VPPATSIQYRCIINLLFSKPEWVGEHWSDVMIDPCDPH